MSKKKIKTFCFIFLSRFSIALCDLSDFVKTVKDILTKTPLAVPLQGIRITFSGESDIYLATAYKRKTVNIEYRLWNRKDLFGHPSGSSAAYQIISQVLVSFKMKILLILSINLKLSFTGRQI